jgi:hypothetical protein
MTSIKISDIQAVKIILIFFVILRPSPAYSQVNGCTDTSANNYDSSATVNDGSCTYNVTNYAPPIFIARISDTLIESSGLQWAGNSLWSFNDRGSTPSLYRIDTVSGVILQTVRLTGATNVDWEEVTFDDTCFYVGDFGNNLNGARTDLKIYKFPYSAIPDYTTNPVAAIDPEKIEVINFTYSDQPQPLMPVRLDSTRFDCEAMIVADGKIHLFTKNWIDLTSTHYIINSIAAGNYVASPSETLNTGYMVTGADKAPGQEIVALLGYQHIVGDHYMHLLSGYSNGDYFNGNKRKINLPNAIEMGQAEGITFRNGDYGYISNERIHQTIFGPYFSVEQKLRSFNISSFLPSSVLAIELNSFSVNKIDAADKISWSFNSPVHSLQIQQSSDGINFNVLKTYSVSREGTFYNKPETSLNYYRIQWQEIDGAQKYSKIISIKNEESRQLSNVFLKANGELSFVLGGSQEEFFLFKLFSTDGKELSRVAGRSYKPGLNTIHFTGSSALNGVVLLTAYGNKQKIPMLLHVLK